MPTCSAINCTNRTATRGVSFHRLPSARREEWLHHIKRENTDDLKELRICSAHFDAGCFKRDLKAELMGTKPKTELEDDAVPTVFSFTPQVKKRKSSEARKAISEKKQYVDNALQATSPTINDPNERCDDVCGDVLDMCAAPAADTLSIGTVSEIATQTDMSFAPQSVVVFCCADDAERDGDGDGVTESGDELDYLDKDFIQSSQESQCSQSTTASQDSSEAGDDLITGVKLIVFWSCILPLLSICKICRCDAVIQKVTYFGFAVTVTLFCTAGHETIWASAPKINDIFATNLLLPASILFNGLTYTQFSDVSDAIGLKCLSERQFYRVQKSFLFPAIHKIYKTFRGIIIDTICNRSVCMSGDARCDSPGYSAKYSTYSLMDTLTNLIVHFHVTHVGQAGNSAKMEKWGLISVLGKVEDLGVEVESLVTDRHQGVTKWLREEKNEISHQFDIWHFSKNIKKKLLKAAKKKDCEIINDWIKAIINHFWWCCKTCDGSVDVLRERWMSLMFHVSNKHRWVGYKHFKRCAHKKLTKKEIKKEMDKRRQACVHRIRKDSEK